MRLIFRHQQCSTNPKEIIMHMSKTQAIKQAKTFVSMPVRRSSTEYVVYAPWDVEKPAGATTDLQARSYSKALAMRKGQIARIALVLMDQFTEEANIAIEFQGKPGSTIESLVDTGLRAYRKALTKKNHTSSIIEAFNTKNSREQRAAFDKLDTSNMRKRSPNVSIGGNGAVFFFDDKNNVCYVCLYSDSNKYELVACTAEDAEDELDLSIDDKRAKCEFEGIQFDDWQQCQAYIRAAEELIEELIGHNSEVELQP